MIVVAIIALLAAIAIPNLLRARLTANESAAQATLRTISTACETYAAANNGSYPANEAALTGATPPYLNRGYNGQTVQGYSYTLTLVATGYTLVAAPSACGTSGTKAYTITTGGVLTEAACT
jgi:type II secretory pathway pseudopilin PulG